MSKAKIHGNTHVYGIRNAVFFNVRCEGDYRWFASREARDRALWNGRKAAVAQGLSVPASRMGIEPVVSRASAIRSRGVTYFEDTHEEV